jgi:hypothetical protein
MASSIYPPGDAAWRNRRKHAILSCAFAYNLTGWPAVVVRVGATATGLLIRHLLESRLEPVH